MFALHVIGGIHPRNGGPSYSVPRLCSALRACGVEVTLEAVHEVGAAYPEGTNGHPASFGRTPFLRELAFSAALRDSIRRNSCRAQIVHVHGLWRMPNIYAGFTANELSKPLIVSPRGMLAPEALETSKWKKRLFWSLLQEGAYRRAALWHATSASEAEDIRRFGVVAPIAIIPNGVDVPDTTAQHEHVKPLRSIVLISRLDPHKNIPSLIVAWSRVAEARRDWQLILAGPDVGGHRAELEQLILRSSTSRVSIEGPIYGEAKIEKLCSGDLFVLPSLSENFGIAVAEALAVGLPAIVTQGAPWSGLELNSCGWWIPPDADSLEAALREATSLPSEDRKAMGARGRAWMQRDFGWEGIGAQMVDVYRWLCKQGDTPACVRMD